MAGDAWPRIETGQPCQQGCPVFWAAMTADRRSALAGPAAAGLAEPVRLVRISHIVSHAHAD